MDVISALFKVQQSMGALSDKSGPQDRPKRVKEHASLDSHNLTCQYSQKKC